MKNLLATIAILTAIPAAANAREMGGALTCGLQNNSSVVFHLISGIGGLDREGSRLTIVANGVLHTVIDTVVTKVNPARGAISVDVVTLNAQGVPDENSGTATVGIDLKVLPNDGTDGLSGTAHIKLTKQPVNAPLVPSNIQFQEEYELVNCVGSL